MLYFYNPRLISIHSIAQFNASFMWNLNSVLSASKRPVFILAVWLFTAFAFWAQVGINTASPDASAVLDLNSQQKGFLPPRMSQLQRDAIVTPALGLMIYNTTSQCAEVKTPTGWKAMACDCSVAPPSPSVLNLAVSGCPGDTALMLVVTPVSGATSYQWTLPSPAQATGNTSTDTLLFNTNGLVQGNATVTAVNACGSSAPLSLTLNIAPPNPGFTANPASPNINNAAVFTAATQNGTHAWTFQNGSPANSSSANPSVTWSSTGTYQVIHQITDANGCVDADTQSVTVVNCPSGTITFNYTGSAQTFTVPACISSVQIQAWGAQGGTGGGQGGYATGTLAVTGGQILQVNVGGQGTSSGPGGWNGGGTSQGTTYGGSGGGGSDVRTGAYTLNDRVIVAGGGGGGSNGSYVTSGGNGGGLSGNPGVSTQGFTAGGGGTQNNGGAAGCCYNTTAPGTFGNGGGTTSYHNAGGGGGWYGGGTGAAYASGGGGSSYLGGVTGGSTQTGGRNGHGQIIISY
jgi:hypothetical protein